MPYEVAKDLWEVPDQDGEITITQYIQRDDLSAIHVFSSTKAEPAWVFIRGTGWFRPDAVTKAKVSSADAIVVQHLTPQKSSEVSRVPIPSK